MSTPLSLTVTASSIPDMARQLADLAAKFNSIGALMGVEHPAGEQVAVADTHVRNAVDNIKAQEIVLAEDKAATQTTSAKPPGRRGRPPAADKKAATAKTAEPPKDRFFEDEDGQPETPKAYVDALSTEEAYALLRAKAKMYFDEHGNDALSAFWQENWAFILPDTPFAAPTKTLEGKRDAIVRALSVFDPATGHDPITGDREDAKSNPADDLL